MRDGVTAEEFDAIADGLAPRLYINPPLESLKGHATAQEPPGNVLFMLPGGLRSWFHVKSLLLLLFLSFSSACVNQWPEE